MTVIVTKAQTAVRYADGGAISYHSFLVRQDGQLAVLALPNEPESGQEIVSIFQGSFLLDPEAFAEYHRLVLLERGFDAVVLDDELFNQQNDALVQDLYSRAGRQGSVCCYSVHLAKRTERPDLSVVKVNRDLCYYSLVRGGRLYYSCFRPRGRPEDPEHACVQALMAQVAGALSMSSYVPVPIQRVGPADEL